MDIFVKILMTSRQIIDMFVETKTALGSNVAYFGETGMTLIKFKVI